MTPIQAQSAHQRGSAFYNPRRVRSVRVKKTFDLALVTYTVLTAVVSVVNQYLKTKFNR